MPDEQKQNNTVTFLGKTYTKRDLEKEIISRREQIPIGKGRYYNLFYNEFTETHCIENPEVSDKYWEAIVGGKKPEDAFAISVEHIGNGKNSKNGLQ